VYFMKALRKKNIKKKETSRENRKVEKKNNCH